MRSSLILVVAVLAAGAIFFGTAGSWAETTTEPIPLSMGFGPGIMSPITEGIPVYTAGDQIWLTSDSHDAFVATLQDPSGVALLSTGVTANGPSRLYTFSTLDPAGTWSLAVSDTSRPAPTLTFTFLVVQNDLAPAVLAGYAPLESGQLRMNFTLPATAQYDMRECAVGSALPEAVAVPVPSGVGTGQLLLQRNGSLVSISLQGKAVGPLNFWLELHQNYSYYVGSPSTVISRDIRVATTTAAPIVPGEGSVNEALTSYAQMRTGRFDLRAFFDTPSGLSVEQSRVMIPNNFSAWISLAGCSASAESKSATFSLSASLKTAASQWPSSLYTMYKSEGVEMVSETKIDLMPAVLTVVASPWGAPLTDSLLGFTPGEGVLKSASGGGSLYLVASHYPVRVGISVLPGQTRDVSIDRPFSVSHAQVNSSKLTVETYVDGVPASGASIAISSGEQRIAEAVSADGALVFYLPQGDYTAEAVLANSTQQVALESQPGGLPVAAFYFTAQTSQGADYFLLATAAVGAAASALLWVKVYRDRR